MFLIGIELWKEGQAYLNKDFIIHFYPFKGKLKIVLEWVPIFLPILPFFFFSPLGTSPAPCGLSLWSSRH